MTAGDLEFVLTTGLVAISGIVWLLWSRARRRAGEQVMTVFDRADASVDLSGWRRVMEDDFKGLRSLFRKTSNASAERWRLLMWLIIGLWALNFAFGLGIVQGLAGA